MKQVLGKDICLVVAYNKGGESLGNCGVIHSLFDTPDYNGNPPPYSRYVRLYNFADSNCSKLSYFLIHPP